MGNSARDYGDGAFIFFQEIERGSFQVSARNLLAPQ
jgi:hypothetical protein